VFFTDTQRLLPDSGESGLDLYECEIVEGAGGLECRLSDLTPSHAGEPAEVQDELPGASEDGSYVYYVANGDLTPGEGSVHGNCTGLGSANGATCNLYVAHQNGSRWETKLVTVLSAEDFPDWNGQNSETFLGVMTSRVSPDGQWLAFMSQRDLTGYDPLDTKTGKPDEEVYLYHAGVEASGALGRGSLVCASCDPTGVRPTGVEYKKMHYGADGIQVWSETQGIAASVPAWTAYTPLEGDRALYQSRYLSNSGRLFFNSNEALVPQDINKTGDVYEYEPPNVGACSTAAPTFGERSNGCVGLISSGTSPEESLFLDASENGEDVFFLTAAKLVEQDYDTSLDVYDAHECSTSQSPCPQPSAQAPPPCTTAEACRPSGGRESNQQSAIFGSPASATFQGPGNLAPLQALTPKKTTKKTVKCKRGFTKKKNKCVRTKRKRQAKRAKKSAHINRRAK
jgi:hypothetical protein